MAVENTVPSLIGGVVIVKDKLGTWTLGDRTIEGNDIASAILKVGVIFIIFAIVTIAISIDKPYLDFILDDLSSNLNSHDLHLLNQNILESKDVHGGRSSISIILSFVLLICLFACVLSSDWLFKFEYSANTAAFVVFNLMSFTLMIFAFSRFR